MTLIGRISEISVLQNALKSSRPELIVVYGRRRIGKTYLVRNVYRNYIRFELSGLKGAGLAQQLENFHLTLGELSPDFKKPQSWVEAFHQLKQYFGRLPLRKKKVIFLDEFPWLDSKKSNFLAAFDGFWNSFASTRSDMIVVVCGSAASYMIKNIIKNKGGLHNRLTQSLRLMPFNLHETELMLKSNNIKLTRYDILQIYMAFGGVPHYLEKIMPGESVAQAIDRLCFGKDGFLRMEYSNVFASLFDQYENHELVIRTLAGVRKGLPRKEIVRKCKIESGGTLSKTLRELEESGFIEKYQAYQSVKGSLYRLIDEYSMFYLKFIEHTKPSESGTWNTLFNLQSYKIWSGFCFETICIKHVDQIKEGLKISGIGSIYSSWIEKKRNSGVQIDFLIDRKDNVINLCEIKFYNSGFTIDAAYAREIEKKINVFSTSTKTTKNVFITFISTFGLNSNEYSRQLVQNELTMNHLFTSL